VWLVIQPMSAAPVNTSEGCDQTSVQWTPQNAAVLHTLRFACRARRVQNEQQVPAPAALSAHGRGSSTTSAMKWSRPCTMLQLLVRW
jgi:hypothetical protein